MDTSQSLRIHVGKDPSRNLILFNGLELTRLRRFCLICSYQDPMVMTSFMVNGCFPVQINPPDDAFIHQRFPLKIGVGQTVADTFVYYSYRPLGCLTDLTVEIEADPPKPPTRKICITAHNMENDLIKELVKIKGVEVIVDHIIRPPTEEENVQSV